MILIVYSKAYAHNYPRGIKWTSRETMELPQPHCLPNKSMLGHP